jgi:hypothetical protein
LSKTPGDGCVDVAQVDDGGGGVVDHEVAEQGDGVVHAGAPVADDADAGVVGDAPVDDAVLERPAAFLLPVVVGKWPLYAAL